ncbi:MAG: YdcF family protein [Nocardiopsaceae bacterium]|nr:YdcF family protein [Nocardiopsaceae bacterium]
MFEIGLAVVLFAVFVGGVIRDPRSYANAVLLGLALALSALAAAVHLAQNSEDVPDRLLLGLLLLVTVAGPFLLAGALVANGVTMARRESLRPANLMSLAAGITILAVVGLTIAAVLARSVQVTVVTVVVDLLFGYVSFLLMSYVIYAFVYGWMSSLFGRADFVVVLGAGLKQDGSVTPLLARRLDKGRGVAAALAGRGGGPGEPGAPGPMLVVSGGQGGDERVAEAEAMRAYLTDRGVCPSAILLEDRSRNTEENLRFSQALMDRVRPGARCVIVTSNFHVLRTAMLARKLGVRGQVTGAQVAFYYWPSAMLREFVAVLIGHRRANLGVLALLVVMPVALFLLDDILSIIL